LARPPPKLKQPKRPRARKTRAYKEDSALLVWIAGGLIFLLVLLMAVDWEAPVVKGWFAKREVPPENLLPLPQKPLPPPQSTAEKERLKKLKEKATEEKRLLAERQAAKPVLPTAPVAPPPKPPAPSAETTPPLVQPVPIGAIPGAPARALPLDMSKLDTERIAAYQVALERIHFSCGFIDGDQGMRTQRMLRAYQASRDLPVTGFLDEPTRDAIGEPGEPFLNYVVTEDDVDSIMPKPPTWIAKSKATRLGYNEIWELLAEKFHCTRGYLKDLNPGITTPVAGTEIIGPKVFPAARIPQAASLRILLSETSIEALDADGRVIAFFPCSIAKDKNKRPHGLLTVKVVDPHPDYTFDPALFADAAKAEGITHKMTIPPGPRNPVGTTWVGLSLPGYGIHGTPDPEAISRTQSHGCFRLANWNAEKVLKMVHVGTPVDVEP
jgi:lipoprotein-anchoring transpeptidase ErfK/SrfK